MTSRSILVYGHLNLNLLDGSAVWLTTLVETLSLTDSTVHLLLRASVETERLLGRVRGLPHVVIHEALPRGSRSMLTDEEAIDHLEALAAEVQASVLITRGLEFTHRVAQSERLAPILWGYVTDFGFPATAVSPRELELMREVVKRVQRLFLQTEGTRGYVEALIPEAAGKTLLMTPTVPDSLFVTLGPAPDSDELKLIYAGKFHPHWRTLEMLELPRLLGERNTRATLTMLGDKFQVPGEWTTAMHAGLQAKPGVHWGGGISRDEVMAAVRSHDVGLSWRTSDLDDSLELSTKLLEYAAGGTPPVLNRTRAHEQLLGSDYPLFLDDDSVETIVSVLAGAKPLLAGLRSHVQEAARAYSSSRTAARLRGYFERAEPGYVTHPPAKRPTVVSVEGAMPPDLEVILSRRSDVVLVRPTGRPQSEFDVQLRGAGAGPLRSERAARHLVTEDQWQSIPLSVDGADIVRPRDADDRWIITLPSLTPFAEARPDLALDLLELLLERSDAYQLVIHGASPWDDPAIWGDPWESEQLRSVFRRVGESATLAEHVALLPRRPDTANWMRGTGWLLQSSCELLKAQAKVSGTVPVDFEDFDSLQGLAHYIHSHEDSSRWTALQDSTRALGAKHDSLVVQRQWLDLVLGIKPMSAGGRFGVGQLPISVITPCYRAKDWMVQCVESFARQTIDHALFEVVLVFNGPDDGSAELAELLMTQAGLQYQILWSEPGASAARNLGVQRARGAWHTFVDVDDTISENYLDRLWAAAVTPGVIPVATMVDVLPEGDERPSALQNQVLAKAGLVSATELWRPMSVTIGKLIPAEVSRRNPFDTSLRSGEDVALFFGLFEREGLDFDTTPAHEGATYRRLIRPGSVSRQERDFDFMVTQRLTVISILEDVLDASGRRPRLGNVIRVMMASQADMIRAYVDESPDELDRVRAAIEALELRHFPWYKLPGKTDELLIAYCFAPFSDPSALVSIKRALERGLRCNVISADLSDRRRRDDTVVALADEVVVEHRQVAGPSVWEEWEGIERFCVDGLAALADIESTQGSQRHMYSRAMFPASHFLAALIKIRRPEIAWTAEFSDPLRKNVFGQERPGPVGGTELARELLAAAGLTSPETTIFTLAEHLAYRLADRLIFTNPHQLSHMLGYLDDDALRGQILDRSVISPQPTLPATYYGRGPTLEGLDPNVRHIAYFGSFYPTRGVGELLSGLRLLAPEQAARIKIHVFTDNQDAFAKMIAGHPYQGSFVGYQPLPYLNFLTAMSAYDVLLVNDARTSHTPTPLNPYLPSKLSDYLGSGRRIWAVVEPGSVMSRMGFAFKSHVDDAAGAARVLASLAAETDSEPARVLRVNSAFPGATTATETQGVS